MAKYRRRGGLLVVLGIQFQNRVGRKQADAEGNTAVAEDRIRHEVVVVLIHLILGVIQADHPIQAIGLPRQAQLLAEHLQVGGIDVAGVVVETAVPVVSLLPLEVAVAGNGGQGRITDLPIQAQGNIQGLVVALGA